mgnify:FL=1
MKKLTIDPRFWLTAAFCAALLAVPPLAVQARDRQLDTALPRPEVSGVMTDEQRLDPTVRVLYTQQILSTNNGYTIGEENSHKYTQMQGKLRQANRRGLISDAQLEYLVQLVQATEAIENNEEDDYIYHSLNYCTLHTDAAGVEYLELSNYVTTETEDGSTRIVTEQPRAYVSIAYLPNNGPILEMRINCDDLPEDDVNSLTLLDNFTSQLNLTIPGEWEQANETTLFHRAADLNAYYTHNSGQRYLAVSLRAEE